MPLKYNLERFMYHDNVETISILIKSEKFFLYREDACQIGCI